MAFDERYTLLLEGKMASSESIRITNEMVALIESHYQATLDEINGAPIVTHLAVTLKKIQANEPLAEIPEVCLKEAFSFKEEMEFAKELAGYLYEHYQIELNLSEQAFLAVHLKNVGLQTGKEA